MTLDEIENGVAAPLIGDAAENCQQIAERVEPLAERTKAEIRQIVFLIDEMPLWRYPPLSA